VGLAPNAIVGVGSVCAFADGVTTAVRFNNQCAAALDSHGTLFITDTSNKRLGAMASASGRMATGAGGSTSADNMLFGGSPTTSATLTEVIMPQSHAASPATTPSGGAGASTGNRGILRLRRRYSAAADSGAVISTIAAAGGVVILAATAAATIVYPHAALAATGPARAFSHPAKTTAPRSARAPSACRSWLRARAAAVTASLLRGCRSRRRRRHLSKGFAAEARAQAPRKPMTCTVALAHLARFRSPGASAGDAPCAPAVAAAAFGPSDVAHVAAELGLTPGWAPVWGPRSAGDAPCAPALVAAAAAPSDGARVAAELGLTPGWAPVCGPRRAGDAPCAPAVAAAAAAPSDGARVAAELGLTPAWPPVWGPRRAGDAPCAPAKSAAAAGPSDGTRVAAQVGLTPGLPPVCDGPRSAGDAHAAAELGLTPGRLPVLSKSRAGVSFRDVSIGEGAWGIPAFAGPGGGGAA